MITVYQFSSSPFSDKVKRALNYKGLDFTTEDVHRLKAGRGHYDHVSPTKKFPAIVIDGQAVNDSTDILIKLDELYPDKPIIPQAPADKALAHVLEEWADESLYFYEMLMRVQWQHNVDSSLDQIIPTLPKLLQKLPVKMIKSLLSKGVAKVTEVQGVGRKPQDQVIADAQRHIDSLEALLEGKQWLVGDAISNADLAVISQLGKLLYASEVKAMVDATKNIPAWMSRIDKVAPR